jgi:hypothetical protein
VNDAFRPTRTWVAIPPQPPFAWINIKNLNTANIGDGVSVSWRGGDLVGYIVINGWFEAGGETWGNGAFLCREAVNKGAFTLPPAGSPSQRLARSSHLCGRQFLASVGELHGFQRFDIPGFGLGLLQIANAGTCQKARR